MMAHRQGGASRAPPDWAEYERQKREWVKAHPQATPTEYEAAMQRIAREVGV